MPIGALVVLVHAVLGIALIVSILGRDLVLLHAATARDLATVRRRLDASTFFERVVRPVSLVALAAGFAAAYLRGQPVLGALQGSTQNWLFVSVLLVIATALLFPTVFLPRARVFEHRLAEAEAVGEVTPALREAISDRTAWTARAVEWAALVTVLYLMVVKPI
jgi:hypothetical protein